MTKDRSSFCVFKSNGARHHHPSKCYYIRLERGIECGSGLLNRAFRIPTDHRPEQRNRSTIIYRMGVPPRAPSASSHNFGKKSSPVKVRSHGVSRQEPNAEKKECRSP
eukprot:scaffold6420_cov168-Amphora_coffeaeformis.AAC.15